MGTTGTIMGTSTHPAIQNYGASEWFANSGIRKWPKEYFKIFDASKVDRIVEVSETEARAMTTST
jgi:cysteine synthase B